MARKTHKSPEQARESILDAAELTVFEVGPAGLRISAVAKKAGMAHPNILHHFGSREGLLNALAARVGERATLRTTKAITLALHAPPKNRVLAMTHVLDTAYSGAEGKVAVWLHLSGFDSTLRDNMQQIVELCHKLRKSIDGSVDRSDTNRLVMLVTLALVGEVISGEGVKEALGYGKQEDDRAHFHPWLAEMLLNLSEIDLSTSLKLNRV